MARVVEQLLKYFSAICVSSFESSLFSSFFISFSISFFEIFVYSRYKYSMGCVAGKRFSQSVG